MKRSFIAILFSPLLFISNSLAQWEILNEGFKGSINTIDFVNENVGWIAGSNGTLLKTIDGGDSWNTISLNENWHISQIDFINESVGWTIGSTYDDLGGHAIIKKSIDGGYNWLVQRQFLSVWFDDLYVLDENNVYVAGDTIYKTTNGGIDWINVSPNKLNRYYHSLWFQNSETGIGVGNYYNDTISKGVILRTTDGGISWNETLVNEFSSIVDLQFLDQSTIFFTARTDTTNYICVTEDMFETWSILTQPTGFIADYHFLDKNIVYMIVFDSIYSQKKLKQSTNGGATWQIVQSFLFSLQKIFFKNYNLSFLLGSFPIGREGYSIICKSTNEWLDWKIPVFSYPINHVCFLNKDTGFLFGGRRIVHGPCEGDIFSTNNGGLDWDVSFSVSGLHTVGNVFEKCVFVNDDLAYLLGGDGQSTIFKTTNSGNSWISVYQNNIDSMGYSFTGSDICFLDGSNGFAIGNYSDSLAEGAGILATADAGKNWNLVRKYPNSNNIWYNLNSACFYDSTIWTVGEHGQMIKYTASTGWIEQTSVTDLPLNKVFFLDDDHGWIAGGYWGSGSASILLKTTNGGETWEANRSLLYLINDIWFVTNQYGWAVGHNTKGKGVILETKDGGNNWIVAVDNLIGPLNSIFIYDNYAWAVGEYGLILRTTNAGPTWVENDDQTLPTEYVLAQNYPNPFNPTTKISYAIPLLGGDERGGSINVQLKVYDALGREAATLVNEEKKPGVYEVEFNPESSIKNPASGVYFYQLRAGSYVHTRKMILLK